MEINYLNALTIFNLAHLTNTEELSIRLAIKSGLIKPHTTCICGGNFSLHARNNTTVAALRCTKRTCRKEISSRASSFFAGSHLSVQQVLRSVYMWVWKLDIQGLLQFQLEIGSSGTIVDWKSFCRDICADHYIKHGSKIGGIGIEVEIDESLLVRRKYNRGRLVSEQWVFGGREVDTLKCFVVAIPGRTRETLINAIIEYIEVGSVIISDCWAAYGDLSVYGYEH